MAQRAAPLPAPWDVFFVGRLLEDPAGRRGVVRAYDRAAAGRGDAPAEASELFGLPIERSYRVEWDDGETEVRAEGEVAALATQRFADESWVLDEVRLLQKVRTPPCAPGRGAAARRCRLRCWRRLPRRQQRLACAACCVRPRRAPPFPPPRPRSAAGRGTATWPRCARLWRRRRSA